MADNEMLAMLNTSHLSGNSAEYIDNLYEVFLSDPNNVSQQWRDYFAQLPSVNNHGNGDISHAAIRAQFLKQAREGHGRAHAVTDVHTAQEKKQAHVLQLINAYRTHGHHRANLDPLGIAERVEVADLALEAHQLSSADLDDHFSTESPLTDNHDTLAEIFQGLQQTYCRSLGVEYMHITDNEQTKWLQQRIESVKGQQPYSPEKKQAILKHLCAAEGLEKYLGARYVGQKRFSLEGGDSLIPLFHEMTLRASDQGVKELVIGMAHRGRLNVLINVLGKKAADLFEEFEGVKRQNLSGDVKYHMGFSSDIAINDKHLHLALAFNPSHLEIIAPVVQGSVRARQRRRGDLEDKQQVVSIVVHGDAAFAGQGVVMETFNFSQARGYSTGGTVHIVINNQIGFTTSNPLDARSTLYCSDIAKIVQAPVFHVNGDDPEAVVFAAQLAFDFRMRFNKDVVIDLVCYRRHGHNEADEPAVTQPYMYSKIRQLKPTRQLYVEQLLREGVVNQQQVDDIVEAYRQHLDKGESIVSNLSTAKPDEFVTDWAPYEDRAWHDSADTSLPLKTLQKLAQQLETLPKDFTPHPVVKRLLQERGKMTAGEVAINWGYAETLAYATLIAEGYPVRLSGQDSGRGTFAHRHAVLHDHKTAEIYIPLKSVSQAPDQTVIIDSVLSEEAVLGFEYGYSAAEPEVLVIWEAQFGDFANGAQVVIDQFISSGEQKWGRLCGLVMFLPHGFEGQGPEHSSARLERFLQLCAQHNMQVCVPTTPAQIYHLLRRQMVRKFRKPLIVMTPKSLLRHKLATSTLDELANGEYQVVIPETDDIKPAGVRRVVLCSGKVYYDLLQQRRANEQKDIAIIRIEQLYPFPETRLREELAKYKKAKEIVWCQEEPQNQGAWYSSRHHMQDCLAKGQHLTYVGRGYFAAPAVGHMSLHVEQQQTLVNDALR